MRMMVTDPARRYRSDPGHPEVCNVFTLHGFFSADEVDQIEVDCRSAAIGCVDCKKKFAQNLSDYFAPFRERRAEYAADPDYVWDVLADGARRAGAIAGEVIGRGQGCSRSAPGRAQSPRCEGLDRLKSSPSAEVEIASVQTADLAMTVIRSLRA